MKTLKKLFIDFYEPFKAASGFGTGLFLTLVMLGCRAPSIIHTLRIKIIIQTLAITCYGARTNGPYYFRA